MLGKVTQASSNNVFTNAYLRNNVTQSNRSRDELNRKFRLIDDIFTLNSDGVFQELAHQIYPSSLVLNQENVNDIEADVLDLNILIKDGKYISNVYDKRDKFKFAVVRLT